MQIAQDAATNVDPVVDPIFEEYLRVCYGYERISQPSASPSSLEDEEFAECDALLQARCGVSWHGEASADRALMEQKLTGQAPLNSTSAGGLIAQTFVRVDGGSEPQFSTEVRVAAGIEACGPWTSNCGLWPSMMSFSANTKLERHAGTLWPSSLKFAAVILQDEFVSEPLLRDGARIIELGAGVGFLVTVLALMGCHHVMATDHPSCEGLSVANVEKIVPTASTKVSYAAFDWMEPLPPEVVSACPWDVVVCSDLLPYTSSHASLCQKLFFLCTGWSPSSSGRQESKHGSLVLMAYEVRSPKQEDGFFSLASEYFKIEAVSSSVLSDEEFADWRLVRLYPRSDAKME